MSDVFVGQISLFAFDFAPRGFAQCNGQIMQISQSQALFALIGVTYGGNGSTTFALPDLRGRVPIGYGTSAQSGQVPIGQVGGVEAVTLSGTSLPAHNHALAASTQVATRRVPTGRMLATDTSTNAEYYAAPAQVTALSPTSIGLTGGNGPHENRQPFLTINYCIALQGIFPSRN
jgi:microcystin-dependent protein